VWSTGCCWAKKRTLSHNQKTPVAPNPKNKHIEVSSLFFWRLIASKHFKERKEFLHSKEKTSKFPLTTRILLLHPTQRTRHIKVFSLFFHCKQASKQARVKTHSLQKERKEFLHSKERTSNFPLATRILLLHPTVFSLQLQCTREKEKEKRTSSKKEKDPSSKGVPYLQRKKYSRISLKFPKGKIASYWELNSEEWPNPLAAETPFSPNREERKKKKKKTLKKKNTSKTFFKIEKTKKRKKEKKSKMKIRRGGKNMFVRTNLWNSRLNLSRS